MSNDEKLKKEMEKAMSRPIREKGENKTPFTLLIDCSGSLCDYQENLAKSLSETVTAISNDDYAKYGSELNIITFNDEIRSSGFGSVVDLPMPQIECDGGTRFYGAVECALKEREARNEQYRAEGVHHYQHIFMILSDGMPTDRCNEAFEKLKKLKDDGKVQVYSIAIGDEADEELLKRISNEIVPCNYQQIRNAFRFISDSISKVSQSTNGSFVNLQPEKFGLTLKTEK